MSRWWRKLRRGKSQNDIGPPLEDVVRNVQLPVDTLEKGSLVHVDLGGLQARHLAPCLGRIVAVLQVFRSEDQCGEKHTSAALQSSHGWRIRKLFLCKVAFWHMRHDQNQVVQSDLKCRVAGSGSAQGLFNISPERQNATSAGATWWWGDRKRPDDLDHLCGRV